MTRRPRPPDLAERRRRAPGERAPAPPTKTRRERPEIDFRRRAHRPKRRATLDSLAGWTALRRFRPTVERTRLTPKQVVSEYKKKLNRKRVARATVLRNAQVAVADVRYDGMVLDGLEQFEYLSKADDKNQKAIDKAISLFLADIFSEDLGKFLEPGVNKINALDRAARTRSSLVEWLRSQIAFRRRPLS